MKTPRYTGVRQLSAFVSVGVPADICSPCRAQAIGVPALDIPDRRALEDPASHGIVHLPEDTPAGPVLNFIIGRLLFFGRIDLRLRFVRSRRMTPSSAEVCAPSRSGVLWKSIHGRPDAAAAAPADIVSRIYSTKLAGWIPAGSAGARPFAPQGPVPGGGAGANGRNGCRRRAARPLPRAGYSP